MSLEPFSLGQSKQLFQLSEKKAKITKPKPQTKYVSPARKMVKAMSDVFFKSEMTPIQLGTAKKVQMDDSLKLRHQSFKKSNSKGSFSEFMKWKIKRF